MRRAALFSLLLPLVSLVNAGQLHAQTEKRVTILYDAVRTAIGVANGLGIRGPHRIRRAAHPF